MIDQTDVGCWIVKGDPKTWDYFTALDEDESQPIRPHVYANGWTLGNNYRNELIRKDDLIALWNRTEESRHLRGRLRHQRRGI